MRKVLLFLTAMLITSYVYSQPKFEFVGSGEKDWGKVMRSDGPLVTQIRIKNTGNKLLEIYGVKPGCGCTTAPIDKKLLDPGETAKVDVTLKIDKDNGPIVKGIEFTTNDPENDRVTYDLKANVKSPIELFPKFLNLGTINKNEKMSARIVVSNHTSKDIKITSVKLSNPSIKTNMKKGQILKAGSHNSVQGIVLTNKDGIFDEKITLITDSKQNPLIEIPVRGMVGQR